MHFAQAQWPINLKIRMRVSDLFIQWMFFSAVKYHKLLLIRIQLNLLTLWENRVQSREKKPLPKPYNLISSAYLTAI